MAALGGQVAGLAHRQPQLRLNGVQQAGLAHPGRPGEPRYFPAQPVMQFLNAYACFTEEYITG